MYKKLQFLMLPLCVITFFVDSLLAMEIEEEQGKGLAYRISHTEMIALMQKAEKGNAEAQYQLALHQLSGEGLKDEKLAHQQASSLLQKAAEQNHGPARELLEDLKNNSEQFLSSHLPAREKKSTGFPSKISKNVNNNNDFTEVSFSLSPSQKEKSTHMESPQRSSPQFFPSFSSPPSQKKRSSGSPLKDIDNNSRRSLEEVKGFSSKVSSEDAILYSRLATQTKLDIDFETLTQSRRFRGEEFLNIDKQLKSPGVPLPLFIRYLKFWSFLHPLFSLENRENEKLKKDQTQTLNNFFYTQCLPALKGDKFLEAKISLAFAKSIKPYEESAFKTNIGRSQRCLQSLLLEGKQIKKAANPEVLYWAWKHRKSFPDFVDSRTWQNILDNAASHSTPSPKAQYALGCLLEKGEEEFEKNPAEAQNLYMKATKNGYKKAQLYLDYLDIKNRNDPSSLLSFYGKLAEENDSLGEELYPRYPYAQFVVGDEIWSRKATSLSTQEEEAKKGIFYLLSAARSGIKEAQERLDQIREEEKTAFYRWCSLSDQCKDDQERVEYLRKKANLAPYSHQLAQMYEDGRGIPFETPEEWLKALKEAKQGYDLASMYEIKGSHEGKQRAQQKIESTEKAKGYILKKIIKGVTVSFSPNHPLYDEFTAFVSILYRYSPGARYLGACIIQQLLESFPELSKSKSSLDQKDTKTVEYTKKVVENLLSIVKSKEFQDHLSEEESEIAQATKLFEYIIKKSQSSVEESSKKSQKESTSELTRFLSDSKGFIYKKIESSGQHLSPTHPLYSDFLMFINKIARYEGCVPEHGAHLVQQLLYFPPNSRQAKVLTASLLDLIDSKKFQQGEKGDTKEDIDDRQVEKLAKLNEAIELTLKPRKLLSPLKKEQEGGVPEKLKVNTALFRDSRVQVFNFYFEQEDKTLFDRGEFDKSVEVILSMFDDLYKKGKISQESLKEPSDDLENTRAEAQYGSRESLINFLTNGEKSGRKIPNHFAHRLIKIHHILESGTFSEDILATQLSSWAIAGLHCATRCESETHKFYNLFVTEGKSQENENNTLEIKVAITLADLRRQLLHRIVPEDEVERLHQINYLEKNHGKKLSLIDPQHYEDPHEKIVKERYRNMKTPLIKHLILEGDATYKVDIEPGRGYGNPEVLIDHLAKVINSPKSPITFGLLRQRFEENYGSGYQQHMSEYYNGDITELSAEELKFTPEGAKALLFSLGYLEKDLGKAKK